jgi:hypothetical protein
MIMAIATQLNLFTLQIDVKTAFLNGTLEEHLNIYMKQPERFEIRGQEHKVLKLRKALYGLKQAPRRWYLTLHEFLTELGFKRCYQDYCIYVKRYSTGVMFLSVYVDDITLTGTHKEDLEDVIARLASRFKL